MYARLLKGLQTKIKLWFLPILLSSNDLNQQPSPKNLIDFTRGGNKIRPIFISDINQFTA
jgi:hypothetical protein